MEKFKNKLKDRGGFTLIEMLIVVAIIAILVAVSIPLVNSSLERAREATDAANERSFKAVLTVSFLNGKYENTDGTTTDFIADHLYMYDAAEGTIKEITAKNVSVYGKSTSVMGADKTVRKGEKLYGYISTKGVPMMDWSQAGTRPNKGAINGGTLISTKLAADV